MQKPWLAFFGLTTSSSDRDSSSDISDSSDFSSDSDGSSSDSSLTFLAGYWVSRDLELGADGLLTFFFGAGLTFGLMSSPSALSFLTFFDFFACACARISQAELPIPVSLNADPWPRGSGTSQCA
jgi:hypothetical protein